MAGTRLRQVYAELATIAGGSIVTVPTGERWVLRCVIATNGNAGAGHLARVGIDFGSGTFVTAVRRTVPADSMINEILYLELEEGQRFRGFSASDTNVRMFIAASVGDL